MNKQHSKKRYEVYWAPGSAAQGHWSGPHDTLDEARQSALELDKAQGFGSSVIYVAGADEEIF